MIMSVYGGGLERKNRIMEPNGTNKTEYTTQKAYPQHYQPTNQTTG